MPTYKVVLTGTIVPGQELGQVKQQIAKLFHLENNPEQLDKLFTGKAISVRKGLSQTQAQSYQQAISKAGLECKVVAEDAPPPVEAPASITPAPLATASGDKHSAYNPYQAPKANLNTAVEETEFGLMEPQALAAGAGWAWIKEGFYYFRQGPGVWIGMIVVFILLTIVLSMIPIVSLILNLLMPVFTAGFMLACHKQYQGDAAQFSDLFSGFSRKTKSLVGVGAWYMLGSILIVVIAVVVMLAMGGMQSLASMAQTQKPDPEEAMALLLGPGMLLAILMALALFVPLVMAYLFAPALVVLHDLPALEAMKLSFRGCLRNILPFLIYGLIALVLMIVAAIPLFLGYLVLSPVLIASIYAAYRQIYTTTAAP